MDSHESRPLLRRLEQGDAAALDDLLQRHLPGLRAFVRLRCGAALRARESASDIVQSSCREVLRDLDAVPWQGEAHFKARLYSEALRKILDRAEYWAAQKRDARREVSLEALGGDGGSQLARGPAGAGTELADVYASLASPSQVAIGREAYERLEAAFDTLTDEQREVIVLARIAGLSHAEIAARLQCTESHARLKLFRALSALSSVLDEGAR